MSSFVSCSVDVVQTNDLVRCSAGWDVLTAQQVIQEGVNSSFPDPSSMLIAFGAGLVVMVPLYLALWGIRALRESIKRS